MSHWTLAQRRIDKNPGVSQAIAADEGALPTPAEGTGTAFSRFTATIRPRPSRSTLIRPLLAIDGALRVAAVRLRYR